MPCRNRVFYRASVYPPMCHFEVGVDESPRESNDLILSSLAGNSLGITASPRGTFRGQPTLETCLALFLITENQNLVAYARGGLSEWLKHPGLLPLRALLWRQRNRQHLTSGSRLK